MPILQRASHHDLRCAFRALLATDACYHTASVFDPMSARIAADLGFEVGILGGSVASLQVLAAPDFALITLSEFVEQATRIGRVSRLPVIADADHGYGNALNVMRTVTELERAGVAALTIEDTLLPAQFGRKSTDLIPVEEGVGKIRAALEARLKADNARLAAAIAAEHQYGPRVAAAVDATHMAMGDLQKATLEHVFAMRAILRPDQQARFDAAIAQSLAQKDK